MVRHGLASLDELEEEDKRAQELGSQVVADLQSWDALNSADWGSLGFDLSDADLVALSEPVPPFDPLLLADQGSVGGTPEASQGSGGL